MRDARLAELALLSDLDSHNQIRLLFVDGLPPEKYYGLTQIAFRQMLMYLVTEGLINGDAKLVFHGTNGRTADQGRDQFIIQDIHSINQKWELDAMINHRGRLRLQQLRDELRAARTKEQFGVLWSDEYREQDLEVAFAFLPAKQWLSVLFMDLDHFKAVNDTLGHDGGDVVMKRYLQIVRDLTERSGEGYRGRGDEVTVILPEADAEKAKSLAEAIRTKIESEFKALDALKRLEKRPTASIGATTCAAGARPSEVLKFVDTQMYVAKNGGKNRVSWAVFTPSTAG